MVVCFIVGEMLILEFCSTMSLVHIGVNLRFGDMLNWSADVQHHHDVRSEVALDIYGAGRSEGVFGTIMDGGKYNMIIVYLSHRFTGFGFVETQ